MRVVVRKELLARIVVFVALMLVQAADASEMSVKVTGKTSFQHGNIINSSANYPFTVGKGNQKRYMFYNTAKVSVKAEIKAESGTIYGSNVILKPAVKRAGSPANNNRTFVYIEDNWGKVELGSNASASNNMVTGPTIISAGTGGASLGDATAGRYFPASSILGNNYLVDQATGAFVLQKTASTNVPEQITGESTMLNRYNYSEDSRKITYYSPIINGFQLGVSFTPDPSNCGSDDPTQENPTLLLFNNSIKNLVSAGLKYRWKGDNKSFVISAVGDHAKNINRLVTVSDTQVKIGNPANFRDLMSYQIGTIIGIDKFKFAFSFGDDGKSMRKAESIGIVSKHFSAGISYESGPILTSLSYFQSIRKDGIRLNDAKVKIGGGDYALVKIISLGADYKVTSGVKIYAELSHASLNPGKVATTTEMGTKGKFREIMLITGGSVSF